jgi:GNAT superfamily N-acetyltransferase
MPKSRSPNLIAAEPEAAERLASLSRAAKLSYQDWAPLGWEPPSVAAERARWQRRLVDPTGWTLIAADSVVALGAIHFTDARTERGEGTAIEGWAHLSGLFVLRASWGEGIGSALHEAALVEIAWARLLEGAALHCCGESALPDVLRAPGVAGHRGEHSLARRALAGALQTLRGADLDLTIQRVLD